MNKRKLLFAFYGGFFGFIFSWIYFFFGSIFAYSNNYGYMILYYAPFFTLLGIIVGISESISNKSILRPAFIGVFIGILSSIPVTIIESIVNRDRFVTEEAKKHIFSYTFQEVIVNTVPNLIFVAVIICISLIWMKRIKSESKDS